jgi:hypothetical protein
MSTSPPSGPPAPPYGQPAPGPFGPPSSGPPGAAYPQPQGPPGEGQPPAPFAAEPSAAADTLASNFADDTRPEPGSLHLQGRRAWKTWQVAIIVLVAVLLGFLFAWWANGSSTSAASNGGGSTYKLPAQGSSGSGSSAASGTGGSTGAGAKGAHGAAATTTTVAGNGSGTTTTTAVGGASGATTTTQPLGQESYLVPAHQATGNWTSPAFNIAGSTWYLGWAYQCNPVPAVRPLFAVYVVTSGASPSGTPAVSETASQGQSVTNLTSTGSQQIVVQAPPQCEWVVKVTGYGGT